MLRLDYISCCLTVLSTALVGRRLWHGWIVAGVNSAILCMIGLDTKQSGFIPANLFCIALYAYNLWNWRPAQVRQSQKPPEKVSCRVPRSRQMRRSKAELLNEAKHQMRSRSIRISN